MGIKPGLFVIAAAGLVVGLSGCGSSATTAGSRATDTQSQMSSPMSASPSAEPGGSAPAAPVIITIKDFMYAISGPVAHGAKVMIKNADGPSHTITSAQRGAFNVTVDGGGGTATFTAPTKPGSYRFVCTFHGNMMGTLVVT